MNLSEEVKKEFAAMGKLSRKNVFAGMSKEQISEYMKRVRRQEKIKV